MIVRCGRCGSQFEAPGEGRYACPACGTANDVVRRDEPESGIVTPPARGPIEDRPSPRVTCPECDFAFIVGEVETAPCPMCGSEVPIATGGSSQADPSEEP